MLVVCAWCGSLIRGNPKEDEVSHGVCPRCSEELLGASGLKVKEVKHAGVEQEG